MTHVHIAGLTHQIINYQNYGTFPLYPIFNKVKRFWLIRLLINLLFIQMKCK